MAGERSYSSLGAKLGDLRIAWPDRLGDGEILLAANRFPSAIAAGLYALEILLKIRICERLDLHSLPKPFEIHDLDGLLTLAGLSRAVDEKKARGAKRNWASIVAMSRRLTDLRYGTEPRPEEAEARAFFSQLRDGPDGVISWISTHA
jgi:hypothetical protein